jgi:ABC-type polysaccharide/polyol phosphate transport system ATPase subunit
MKVISVENVSKKFILAHDRPKNLADAARVVFSRRERKDFWALKDVSFEVERGEALGIIGHNGAGKSTMLKLLTGIMEPTDGRIRTRGRVSALIEVGAGFHPEMTGRENIYLNGSILGMTRREIDNKFDDMVAFAELEQFIDTPVKRYSSGMYARLGFAVAANVEPEILIVDEVLSVGDAAFQEKCTKIMRQLRDSNRTILFVSHNLAAVSSLCDRVAVLDHGQITLISDPQSAVKAYRESVLLKQEGAAPSSTPIDVADTQSPLAIRDIEIMNGEDGWITRTDRPLKLRLHYFANEHLSEPRLGIFILGEGGHVLVEATNVSSGGVADLAGSGICDVTIGSLPLVPGRYSVVVRACDAFGAVPYDEGRIRRELLVLPPIDPVDAGFARSGVLWVDSRWSYKDG